jgi:hypothetical protein
VVDAYLDWGAGTIDVTTDMEADNRAGFRIHRLELNTIAAQLGHIRKLKMEVDGRRVSPTVSGQTLLVDLPIPIKRNRHVSVHTTYRATLLHSTGGHDWLWSQSSGVAAVYRFIPWLSREVSFERDNIGDPFVTPVASSVQVTLSSSTPLVFATSGKKVASSADAAGASRSVTFVATNVRDFNFTASPGYETSGGRSDSGGTKIRVYGRWLSAARRRAVVRMARDAVARYAKWVGVLPCRTLSLAETAGGSAMESPCMVWLPRNAAGLMPYFVAHELGHQWFYGVVGNDQSTNPFLDEAMTDFMARRYLHQLRHSRCDSAPLDGSIYDYTGCYYETVYIQGSNFIDGIRTQMGTTTFWKTVRTFWHDHAYQIVTTKDLLEAFRAVLGDSVLHRYRQRFPTLYPS